MEKAPWGRGHPAALIDAFLQNGKGAKPASGLPTGSGPETGRRRQPGGAAHSTGGSEFFADDAAERFLQRFAGALDVLAQGFVD